MAVSNITHGYLAWYFTLEKVRAKLNYCGTFITLSLGPQKHRIILTLKSWYCGKLLQYFITMVPGPNVIIFTVVIYCHSKATPPLCFIKQCYHGNYHGVSVSNITHGYLAWYFTL